MQEKLISFETAKLAKEKGFNWKTIYRYTTDDAILDEGELMSYPECCCYPEDSVCKCEFTNELLYWNKYIWAPTQSLLQKWLRERYKLHINMCSLSEDCFSFILEKLDDGGTTVCGGHLGKINYKTYEEALEAGLLHALSLI